MTFDDAVKNAKRNKHMKYVKLDSFGDWEVIGRNMAWNCADTQEVYGFENNFSAPLTPDNFTS